MLRGCRRLTPALVSHGANSFGAMATLSLEVRTWQTNTISACASRLCITLHLLDARPLSWWPPQPSFDLPEWLELAGTHTRHVALRCPKRPKRLQGHCEKFLLRLLLHWGAALGHDHLGEKLDNKAHTTRPPFRQPEPPRRSETFQAQNSSHLSHTNCSSSRSVACLRLGPEPAKQKRRRT